jgi:hypothetical protein
VSGRAADPSWGEDDRRHVWHPYTQIATAPPAVPIVRAEGAYLRAADGRKFLDGISSWWVNYPLARLGAARAASGAGDAAGARVAYEGFLSNWPDADPDLPVVVAARRELAALGSRAPVGR